jgi:hypothetical protein
MVTAWRCELGDDLPNGRAIAMEWMRPHTYAAAGRVIHHKPS